MNVMNGKYNNTGSLFCLAIILYLIVTHFDFWFFKELSDGGHVSGDFLEAGVTLQLPERIAGFFTAGIPLIFFSIFLYQLALLFGKLKKSVVGLGQIIKDLFSCAIFALIGSVTMMFYPTVLSLLFIAMNSMQQNMIILSVEPLVFMLFSICILFFLLIRSIQTVFQNHNISYGV